MELNISLVGEEGRTMILSPSISVVLNRVSHVVSVEQMQSLGSERRDFPPLVVVFLNDSATVLFVISAVG